MSLKNDKNVKQRINRVLKRMWLESNYKFEQEGVKLNADPLLRVNERQGCGCWFNNKYH